jgi:hypothetical protein
MENNQDNFHPKFSIEEQPEDIAATLNLLDSMAYLVEAEQLTQKAERCRETATSIYEVLERGCGSEGIFGLLYLKYKRYEEHRLEKKAQQLTEKFRQITGYEIPHQVN